MEKKSLLMLRVLINRYHKGPAEELTDKLPEKISRQFFDEEIRSDDVSPALGRPEDLLHSVHYSWIVDTMQRMKEELKPYAAASLPNSQKRGVCRLSGIEPSESPISEPVKGYFLSLICQKLGIYEVIPSEYIAETPLRPLLNLTKAKMIELIDLLGVYNLAAELRKIINKEKLRHLSENLSEMQRRYLKTIQYFQEKFSQEKLGLQQLPKKHRHLQREVHKHGMIRLAKALSGTKPEFMWHIRHLLDTGRSAVLDKYWSEQEIPLVTAEIAQQVLHALNFLQNWEARA